MADREHLRALVDSLPEGALESAQAYLKAIQIWPPKEPEYPPEVEQHRKELEAKRDKFLLKDLQAGRGPSEKTRATPPTVRTNITGKRTNTLYGPFVSITTSQWKSQSECD